MRTKSRAQSFLEQVEKLDALIANKLIEKQQWMDLAQNITPGAGEGRVKCSASTTSKMAEAVNWCVDIEGEIDAAVEQLVMAKKEVLRVIEQVESPVEYRLLHMRHIQNMTLEEIAEAFGKDYSWVTTTQGRARKSVQEILDRE